MALFKLIVSAAALVALLAGFEEDVPAWAQMISFAIVLCGFTAHKED